MEIDKLKETISLLSDEELIERKLYLRKLALGEIEGPSTGYASIDKPWLKFYSIGNIILKPFYSNAYDYLIANVSNDYCLLNYYGREYYVRDIKRYVESYINKFHNMGIKHGDTISIMALDVPEVIFMWLALTKLGAITNLIKFDEVPERIKLMCEMGESDYLFVSGVPFILDSVSKSIEIGNDLKKVVVMPVTSEMPLKYMVETILEDSKKNSLANNTRLLQELKVCIRNSKAMQEKINSFIESNEKFISLREWKKEYKGKNTNIDTITVAPDEVSIIVYTGGTTGKPKAVQLTNKNIISMAHDFKYSEFGFDPGKTSMNILPPGPAYYLNATYALMCCEVMVRLISKFSPQEYPELIKKYRPNIFLSGPILLKAMVDQSVLEDATFMTAPISGGDKLHDSEEIRFNEYIKSIGGQAVVHQGYGESESTAAATYSKDNAAVVGSIGIPLLNVEVAIFEYTTPDDFTPNVEEKQYNQIGEICITGPTIMKGYKSDTSSTDDVLRLHSDGKYWLHTDDLGYMDKDGRLFHCGRAKRMLTRSGNKVWLAAIEDIIKKCPYIQDVCVVKGKDDIEREIPVAFIVLKDNAPDNITKILDEEISRYQSSSFIPKYYINIDAIPVTLVNNKVDFKKLEESLKDYDLSSNQKRLILK